MGRRVGKGAEDIRSHHHIGMYIQAIPAVVV